MRLLLDTCISARARRALDALGHDVKHTADWPADPGDAVILAHALQEGRILVTLDKDFGELAIVHGEPHCGIVRLVDLPAADQGPACHQALVRHGDALVAGGIVTVEPGRLRLRPADQ